MEHSQANQQLNSCFWDYTQHLAKQEEFVNIYSDIPAFELYMQQEEVIDESCVVFQKKMNGQLQTQIQLSVLMDKYQNGNLFIRKQKNAQPQFVNVFKQLIGDRDRIRKQNIENKQTPRSMSNLAPNYINTTIKLLKIIWALRGSYDGISFILEFVAELDPNAIAKQGQQYVESIKQRFQLSQNKLTKGGVSCLDTIVKDLMPFCALQYRFQQILQTEETTKSILEDESDILKFLTQVKMCFKTKLIRDTSLSFKLLMKYKNLKYVEYIRVLITMFNTAGKLDFKQILPQMRNVQREDIGTLKDYYLSPKIDGIRTVIFKQSDVFVLLQENNLESFQLTTDYPDFVIEAELITNTLYIHDIYQMNSNIVWTEDYKHRYGLMSFLHNEQIGQYSVQLLKTLEFKNVSTIQQILELQTGYPKCDGYVFKNQNVQEPQLKWKPSNMMTIDFYCEQVKKDTIVQGFLQERVNQTPYVLFSYIDLPLLKSYQFNLNFRSNLQVEDLYLVPFQTFLQEVPQIFWHNNSEDIKESLNGKVCEFLYDASKEEWILYRIRHDKNPSLGQFGNYFITANKVFYDILHPIQLQDLIQSVQPVIGAISEKSFTSNDFKFVSDFKSLMMKLLHILNGENSTLLSNFDNKWDIKLLSEKHKEYLILTQDKYKVCQHIYHLLKKRETKYPALASIKIYAKDEPIQVQYNNICNLDSLQVFDPSKESLYDIALFISKYSQSLTTQGHMLISMYSSQQKEVFKLLKELKFQIVADFPVTLQSIQSEIINLSKSGKQSEQPIQMQVNSSQSQFFQKYLTDDFATLSSLIKYISLDIQQTFKEQIIVIAKKSI